MNSSTTGIFSILFFSFPRQPPAPSALVLFLFFSQKEKDGGKRGSILPGSVLPNKGSKESLLFDGGL